MLHDVIFNARRENGLKLDWSGTVPFYFKDRDIDSGALLITGREFFRRGVMDLPFKSCLYIREHYALAVQEMEGKLLETFQRFDDFSPYSASRKEYFFNLFTLKGTMAKVWGVYRPAAPLGETAVSLLFKGGDNPTEAQVRRLIPELEDTLICATMLLNTKFAVKEEHKVSDALNKKREKKGRPRLSDYTVIKVPAMSGGDGSGDGTGSKKRPHWRRGHVRRLSSGKLTPVAPCIINFDGKEVPAPKAYDVFKPEP